MISQAPLNYKKRPPSSSIQMNILSAQLCPNQVNLMDFIKWAINSGLNLPEAMVPVNFMWDLFLIKMKYICNFDSKFDVVL